MQDVYRALVISLPEDVYQELRIRVGEDDISRHIEHLLRPRVDNAIDLEAEYRAMAADEEHEREAREWLAADLGETLG